MGCAQSAPNGSKSQKHKSSAGVIDDTQHGDKVLAAGESDPQLLQQSLSRRGSSMNSSSYSGLSSGRSFNVGGCRTDSMVVEDVQIPNLRKFTYLELKRATKNFDQDCKLGEGGFGPVYKGWIDQGQGQRHGLPVAVKQLNKDGLQGHKEWLAEVQILGAIHHPNLVKLIGLCAEDDQHLLVYEFMPQNSLDPHLFRMPGNSTPLPWSIRMKIALGAARGLAYLHEEAPHKVIYRDLKAANILLDHEFTAKLSDFGLARDGPAGDKTHVSTRVMGTQGYPAPEYIMTGHLTPKSDVYSFGVLLLELLSGRRSLDKSRPIGEQNLVEWAKQYMRDRRRLFKLMDPRLEGEYPVRGAQAVVALASSCLHRDPKARPLMSVVVENLEGLQGQDAAAAATMTCPVTCSVSSVTATAYGTGTQHNNINNFPTSKVALQQQYPPPPPPHHYGIFLPHVTTSKQTTVARQEGIGRKVGG